MPRQPARTDNSRHRRRYHRGDVQSAAIAAALSHLERHGAPTFTLRQIATELGIAHPSLYNHFASRDALVDAIAVHGFQVMLARARCLIDAHADPLEACQAFGRDIIAFAREQPALYRLMFGPLIIGRKTAGGPLGAATEAPLRLAADLVARAQEAGRLAPGDPLMVAASMWASAHGLALLIIDGRLGVLGAERGDELVDLTFGAIVAGFTS